MSDRDDRTAHWGSCEDDDCGTAMVIYAHRYAGHDLPDEDDWENGGTFYIDCPVCGGTFDWGGSDPAENIIKNY